MEQRLVSCFFVMLVVILYLLFVALCYLFGEVIGVIIFINVMLIGGIFVIIIKINEIKVGLRIKK